MLGKNVVDRRLSLMAQLGLFLSALGLLCLGLMACSPEAESASGSYFGAAPPDALSRLGKGSLGALAFAPDAETFVVGSEVGLYSYRTSPVEELWASPTAAGVTGVAFSPDGEILAVGLKNRVLILLDAETGQPMPGSAALRMGEVNCLVWSPDQDGGQRLLGIGFSNGVTALVNLNGTSDGAGEILFTLGPAQGGVTSMAFSPSGTWLAVGDSSGELTLWDATTGQIVRKLEGHGLRNPVTAMLWLTGGSGLISGGKGGRLIEWDLDDGSVRNQVQAHPDAVSGLGWIAGADIFQSISTGGSLKTWQPGLKAAGAEQVLDGNPAGSAWSLDGSVLLTGFETSGVGLWETQSGAENVLLASLVGFSAPGEVATKVAWSRSGDRLAAAHGKQIYIWKTADLEADLGAPAAILSGHGGSNTAMAWSPDGKTLATGARDRAVILWNPESGELLQRLEGHGNSIWALAWAPDGERLASTGGLDDSLLIWDAKTGEQQAELPGDTYGLFGLAWSPDGNSLAAGTGYGRVLIWDVSRDEIADPYASWFGHLSWVGGISWTEDGQNLASSSADRTIVVWDVIRGSKQHTLTGHTDAVLEVAFEAGGERLASASADGLVIVWKFLEDTAVVLPGHTGAVGGVDWSPDSKLVSGSADGTVIFWDVEQFD